MTKANLHRKIIILLGTSFIAFIFSCSNKQESIDNGISFNPIISADGNFICYETNNFFYIPLVLRDQHSSNISALTYKANENTQKEKSFSISDPDLSADGKFLTFSSQSIERSYVSELGIAHGNQIYVTNTETGENVIASVDTNNQTISDSNTSPSISANGRFVVFRSLSSNSGSEKGEAVFLKDLQTKDLRIISPWNSDFNQKFTLSGDGRFIALSSETENYAWLRDRVNIKIYNTSDNSVTKTTIWPEVRKDTKNINNRPDISSLDFSNDGRYLVFISNVSNLDPSHPGKYQDGPCSGVCPRYLYMLDTQSQTISMVAIDMNGNPISVVESDNINHYWEGRALGNGNPFKKAGISANGRFVVFKANNSDLPYLEGGIITKVHPNVYVKDLVSGNIQLASSNSNGIAGDSASSGTSISGDGRYIVFYSDSGNLTPDEQYMCTNGQSYEYIADSNCIETYLKDLHTGQIERMSGNKDLANISSNGETKLLDIDK